VKTAIQIDKLPAEAFLGRYEQGKNYTDCYSTQLAGSVSLPEYVEAFYTTWVFKLERLILGVVARKPSTDAEAQQLASGVIDRFSAWSVEERANNQVLLRDMTGRTRTWLMVCPAVGDENRSTHLYLGSAVVPVTDSSTGKQRLGIVFRASMGFHKLYSRILLRTACSRLERAR